MTRRAYEPTRVDQCVSGRYTERLDAQLMATCDFTAAAIVFDNQWVEFRDVMISRRYTGLKRECPNIEHVPGWYRVPVRRIDNLRYDLCTEADTA